MAPSVKTERLHPMETVINHNTPIETFPINAGNDQDWCSFFKITHYGLLNRNLNRNFNNNFNNNNNFNRKREYYESSNL